MRRIYCIDFLLPILLLIVTGCQFTQAAFPRMASNAGSAFAAAATALAYAHEGKVTYAYAAASFVNYQSELDGLDQALPSQSGAPDKRTVQHLIDLYKVAIKAVDSPCLSNSCDWRTQVDALNRTSKAFLEAGGS
jgi:L-aminopeptidase/D-esterase-like protein